VSVTQRDIASACTALSHLLFSLHRDLEPVTKENLNWWIEYLQSEYEKDPMFTNFGWSNAYLSSGEVFNRKIHKCLLDSGIDFREVKLED
jgi:hypothetical protein